MVINCIDDFYEKLSKIGFIQEKSDNESVFEVLNSYGNGYIKRFKLQGGIDLCIMDMYLKNDFYYNFKVSKKYLEIVYVKEGSLKLFDYTKDKINRLNEDELIFCLDANFEGKILHPKNTKLKYISLNIEKEFNDELNKFGIDLNKIVDFYLKNDVPQNIYLKNVLISMMNTKLSNEEYIMFLMSKIYEIFRILFSEIKIKSNKKEFLKNYTKDDIKRLYKAKWIIENNLKQPPSINDLSKEICLNTFKLKVGFKDLFDETIYGYLRLLRIKKSKKLLLETEFSIEEIGLQVGYKTMSGFNNMFKKYIDLTPLKYREKHR
ncbi:MAG: AraC family transcriptional regulator [Peptostreptococcaceae bacterium]|nr:AraC family transcriptional regulator [Peptostreptococcaceae bacterium]